MSNIHQPPREDNARATLPRRLLKAIVHNGGFKILSLLLALLLWAGLITQDPSLTRERIFTDVNVSVTGDMLQRNGLIVTSDLSEVVGKVTLRVAVPQMQYQAVAGANYNPRIDLSRITEPGVQTVRITASSSSTYGTVLEVTPAEVEITVEEYVTVNSIPVNVQTVGNVPEGFWSTSPSASPSQITVSGPKSLVDRIDRAEVTVELDSLPAREGTIRSSVAFRLTDKTGETIESDLLEITTSQSVLLDRVTITQQLYSLKTIALSETGLLRGTPAEGYEVKFVTITPQNITIAGSADMLAELDFLYPDAYVDLNGLTDSVHKQMQLRKPDGQKYMSAENITVAVEIGPVIQDSTFSNLRLSVENVADGLKASLGTKNASVIVSGPQLWIKKLRSGNITLYCDAYGLPVGTYDLPVLCAISGSDSMTYSIDVSPATIEVTITEK